METFKIGQRVQLEPGLDRWMMGDRYGEVIAVAGSSVRVKLDKSGDTLKFHASRLESI